MNSALSFMYPAACAAGLFLFEGLLIGRYIIPVIFIVSREIAALAHKITSVALHGVDTAVLYLIPNPHMVRRTVLASIIPIEKDDVAGARRVAGPASGVFLMGYSLLDAIQNANSSADWESRLSIVMFFRISIKTSLMYS